MRFHPTAFAALAVALLAADAAHTQAVHGALVDSAGRPVEQVLVALVGEGGRQQGAALTSATGEFRIRAPAAGRYSLRAERVGYASVTIPAFELKDGETREQRVVASWRAVALQGVVVTARNRRCAVRPGTGMATATLWEEARKALNAAEFSNRAGLFWYDVVRWERDLGLNGGTVMRDVRQARSGVSQLPFVSIPPAELSEHGFIRTMPGDSMIYAAPDASVLLSDEFLDDHCFRVAAGRDPALVGLEFEPVAGRHLPDVHGVLWLDRASAELRRVEYRYVNGPPESADPAVGGTVEFERINGGPWIVRRWAIRMPVVTMANRVASMDERSAVTRVLEVRAVHEAGGEVTSARLIAAGAAGSAMVRATAPALVEGVVWDSVARAPLAGAHVYLSGTGAEAVTGADGRYRLEAPAAGTYLVAFGEPSLGPIAAAAAPRTVVAELGRTVRADLAIPSPERVAAALCPEASLRTHRGVVTGRVAGVRPDSVSVRATWQRITIGTRVVGSNSWSESRPDAEGFYVLCGVPEGDPVEVAVRPFVASRQHTTAAPQDRSMSLRAAGTELSRVEVTVPRGVPLRLNVGPLPRAP